MEPTTPHDLLAGLADGSVPLRKAAGLSARDVAALAQLGAASFQGKRFDAAARVYAALAAIEPDQPAHLLHLAYAEAGAGKVRPVCDAVQRFLDLDVAQDPADVARALLLRATTLQGTDQQQAAADVFAARALAARSPAAKKVVEGGA